MLDIFVSYFYPFLEDWKVGNQIKTEQERLVRAVATILKKTLTQEKGSEF